MNVYMVHEGKGGFYGTGIQLYTTVISRDNTKSRKNKVCESMTVWNDERECKITTTMPRIINNFKNFNTISAISIIQLFHLQQKRTKQRCLQWMK